MCKDWGLGVGILNVRKFGISRDLIIRLFRVGLTTAWRKINLLKKVEKVLTVLLSKRKGFLRRLRALREGNLRRSTSRKAPSNARRERLINCQRGP